MPLADPRSGLVVEPGLLTCLVSSQPDEAAALADRLGRFGDDDDVTLGDVRLADLPVETRPPPHRRQRGRSGALLGDAAQRARPVAGPADDDACSRRSRSRTPRTCSRRCRTGSTRAIDERGRSFSGGQRQRLVLARALLSDAELLVLVEPTSAVDAHTEARIARRLHEARAGRTTVVVTTSPLVLDRADRVVLLEGGRVVAEGRHRELLRTSGLPRHGDAR